MSADTAEESDIPTGPLRLLWLLSKLDDADEELRHSQGDKLLCKTLRELGYGAAVDKFESWNKWYA